MMTERRSPEARQYRKLYKAARWQHCRAWQLKEQPWCQSPHCKGKKVEAKVVDHITPHRGDTRLFFNRNNHMSLCKPCHDIFKASEERGGLGFKRGCDEKGYPLSEDDEWYEKAPTVDGQVRGR